MGFFNLVEQQHAVGRLADSVCQQATILIAHITCWRADELRYRMLLRIFAHVETHQRNAQFLG